MATDDGQEKHDNDAREASERRASTSIEFPTNVTRSTQDLTIGGSDKHAESEKTSPPSPQATEDGGEQSGDGLSNAELAVDNQERALESGAESPG